MASPKRDKSDDLPANTHKIGGMVSAVLIVLALVGLVTPILIAVYHSSDTSARSTSNAAAEANQRNQHCATAQGLRWRKATTRFQIAISDLAEATDAEKPDVHKRIRAARSELAAVDVDDDRLKDGNDGPHPLCPYVVGKPDLTPDRPVDPTPAKVTS